MRRNVEELKRTFDNKITIMEELLSLALKEELLSFKRKEYLVLVAVELRTLFCHSGGEPLITTAQLEKDMIFPLHNMLSPFNELNELLLVGSYCDKRKCTFQTAISLDGTSVASVWLSYKSWIHQIVIDLKTAEYTPLSREEVIKLVADRNGAHVDPRLHPLDELIETTNVMPLRIMIGGEECEADCSNLLCESICSIANEVIYAYKNLHRPLLIEPIETKSGFSLKVFDFSEEKGNKVIDRYKYAICSEKINSYNTNKFYSCRISTHPYQSFKLIFRDRVFSVGVIRTEDYYLK